MIKAITDPICEDIGLTCKTDSVFKDIYLRLLSDEDIIFGPTIYKDRICLLNLHRGVVWTPQGINQWVGLK